MIEKAMDRGVFTANEYKTLAVHDMAIRLAIDVLSSKHVEGVGIMEWPTRYTAGWLRTGTRYQRTLNNHGILETANQVLENYWRKEFLHFPFHQRDHIGCTIRILCGAILVLVTRNDIHRSVA